VGIDALEGVDRYLLSRYGTVAGEMARAHEAFDFQRVSHLLNNFATVDLSAFYLDVSKDRLYTLAPGSRERRSAQTVLYRIADGLARLAAPLLPFMAEDVWSHLPGAREDSVHLAQFPADAGGYASASVEERWARLIVIRDHVNAALEQARQQKLIGTALAAAVTIDADAATMALLREHEQDLPMLFITSAVTLGAVHGQEGVAVRVDLAPGDKCPRCWRFVEQTSEELCLRCTDALGKAMPARG